MAPRHRKRQKPPQQKPEGTARLVTPLSAPQILDSDGKLDDGGIVDTPTSTVSADIPVERVCDDGIARDRIQLVAPERIIKAQTLIKHAREASKDQQLIAIDEAISEIYPYRPRSGQRLALHTLIYEEKDLILIAKTSFGKSMILQVVSVLLLQSITLVILPLQQIGEEQTIYIKKIGGQPCFLNRNTINGSVLEQIREGKYTHVLISPELAISNQFAAVLRNPQFQARLGLVVIDEVHLVSLWGRDFRPAYTRLNQLRSILGEVKSWFAYSATLDLHTLNSIVKNVVFSHNIKIQRTSIDRPEIRIRVGEIPKKSHEPQIGALRFLFSSEPSPAENQRIAYESSSDIPKTIVFFNSTRAASTAREHMISWLQTSEHHSHMKNNARAIVRLFHRRLADRDKEAIITDFQQLGKHSVARVICATEALGVGVNFPDVERVVQWSINQETEPAVFWQRGGRASRNKKPGDMILFLDPAKIDPVKKSHGKFTSFWDRLIRPKPSTCYRQAFLDFFAELDTCCELSPHCDCEKQEPNPCCSLCNADSTAPLDNLNDQFYAYHGRGRASTASTRKVEEAVTAWATAVAVERSRGYRVIAFADQVLSKESRTRVSNNAMMIQNKADLKDWIQDWRLYDQYGDALFQVIREAWSEHRDNSQLSQRRNPPDSAPSGNWKTVMTPITMTRRPSTQSSTSHPEYIQTPLPKPDHTDPPMPCRTKGGRKRKPLVEISENAKTRKGRKRSDMEAGDNKDIDFLIQ